MLEITLSSDVEVCAFKGFTTLEDVKLPNLIPPAQFIFDGYKTLGFYNEDKTKPIFINEDIIWFGDGALFEVAFQPAKKADELYNQVKSSSHLLSSWLEQFDYKLGFVPTAYFDMEKYKKVPNIFQACIAGCNSDKNAIIPNYKSKTTYIGDWDKRGMGGHVHMSLPKSYGNFLHKYQRVISRFMALTASMVNVLVTPYPEMEIQRQERFGHPGSYRTPIYDKDIYGFEYRAPSSAWLLSQESIDLMFKAVEFALEFILNDVEDATKLIESYLEEAILISQHVSKQGAEGILSELQLI